jgi:aromatic-L-amino-acid decarboxylase
VQFRAVAVDDDYVLKGDALRSAIKEDVDNGLKPFFVIATVGTTSTGAVDRIAEVGAVGKWTVKLG